MKLRYKALIGIGIAFVALTMLAVTKVALAANPGEALNGLKEFFTFLLGLANIGKEALIAYWGTL